MPTHVAIAILVQDQKFLMQLRNDKPDIVFPGVWGFFGGHMEPGETPAIAVVRELEEEIGYAPPGLTLFAEYPSQTFVRHVFAAPLDVPLTALELNEGWDMALVSIDQVQQGECYSAVADQVRSLAPPHRQILLDYWQQCMAPPEAPQTL
ncbi:MAG: NUDIX hydrolase [Kaiparowitsia implicata GSE-PSE-MK54-09C]|jgi:8-oxo-dGTP pyrophosphatase MutT (NUDIX family)|nr:NUDIX hydrolase [Kaiparowitsia implicata GSE-PSE-MK54-09C]